MEQYSALADKHGLKLEKIGLLKEFGHITGDPRQDDQTVLKITLK